MKKIITVLAAIFFPLTIVILLFYSIGKTTYTIVHELIGD